MSPAPVTLRASSVRAERYPFRINANARYSALQPLQLYSRKPSSTGASPVPFYLPVGLDPVHFLPTHVSNSLDLYGPDVIVDYPDAPFGSYLTIEARETPGLEADYRPSLWFVLRLPAPTIVSKIAMIGNLLLPPEYDARGPLRNFGVPRSIKIYALDDFPPDIGLFVPHPRDWRLMYSSTDFRALWGWTPILCHPTHCRYLAFVMNDLPLLTTVTAKQDDKEITRDVHGISIQRLAVYAYEYGVNITPSAAYSPAVSWQGQYDVDPSRYWQTQGVAPVVQDQHESVYQEPGYKGQPGPYLLPSALVGLPSQHLTAGSTYVSRPHYSGDVTNLNVNETNLVLAMIDDEPPSVEGLLLEEEWPRRVENDRSTRHSDSTLEVYYTDDPQVAFSPHPKLDGWKLATRVPFASAFQPYGLRVDFPFEVIARFYRLRHVLDPAAGNKPRRFELKSLRVLRARNRTLTACTSELLQLDHVEVRISGNALFDDYGFADGQNIMDVVVEASTRGQPYRPWLSLRNMTDIREQTRSQVIANARQTRPLRQKFHERSKQGDRIVAPFSDYGTEAHTRTKQVVDSISLQHMIAVTKQTMLIHAPTDAPARFQSGKAAALINNLKGVTTDRDAGLGAATRIIPIDPMLGLISQTLGINIADIAALTKLACFWSNSNLASILGIAEVTELLQSIIGTITDLPGAIADAITGGIDIIPWSFGSGLWGSGGSSGSLLPSIPCLNLATGLQLGPAFRSTFYPGGWAGEAQRPSVSLSGSVGGQFFGGGSMGISMQLDAGKGIAKSTGEQGHMNETLTYYEPDNVMYTDSDIESSDVARFTDRVHFHELDEEYYWKGKEVLFQGTPTDIVLATIQAPALLRPPENAGDWPDRFRLRVGYLPQGVTLDVTFVGMAIPLEGLAGRAPLAPPHGEKRTDTSGGVTAKRSDDTTDGSDDSATEASHGRGESGERGRGRRSRRRTRP